MCLYSLIYVEPVRKPHCWFSHEAAHIGVMPLGLSWRPLASLVCSMRFQTSSLLHMTIAVKWDVKHNKLFYRSTFRLRLPLIIMSPPDRVGRHIVFPRASVRPSVRLSVPPVRPSVCPSQIVSAL